MQSGRGEASGVFYLDDDADHIVAAIEAHRDGIESGDRPPRPARAAAARRRAQRPRLRDVGARSQAQTGPPVWQLAGLTQPKPLVTTFTLGADDPGNHGRRRAGLSPGARAIKVKLTGELELDIARVRAVRAARPDAVARRRCQPGLSSTRLDPLIAGAGSTRASRFSSSRCARGREADLEGSAAPIPIAADESALSLDDVPGLVGRFD